MSLLEYCGQCGMANYCTAHPNKNVWICEKCKDKTPTQDDFLELVIQVRDLKGRLDILLDKFYTIFK